jgi:histidine ammonia-lyase
MRSACAPSRMRMARPAMCFECVVVVDQELASVTDNPAVSGTPEHPVVSSEAHAVAPALGQAADSLAIALAQIAAMSERRMDRLVNPLVSGLPPFLASDAGSNSGFMIAQYTAAALSNENRRLAAPASLDGGLTSGLQEDFLAHPTAAANKLLSVIDNCRIHPRHRIDGGGPGARLPRVVSGACRGNRYHSRARSTVRAPLCR